MKSFPSSVLAMYACCFLAKQAVAQSVGTLTPLSTHQEQAAALNGFTKAEKADWMRTKVLESRYGQRGLNNLFKGFEGKHYLDPEIPGVTKNLNALNSQSQQQAKGAVRTLLFATKA